MACLISNGSSLPLSLEHSVFDFLRIAPEDFAVFTMFYNFMNIFVKYTFFDNTNYSHITFILLFQYPFKRCRYL